MQRQVILIIKDAGKALVQVIDGLGMSVTDARLCFERHATSKYVGRGLFSLHTKKGFVGSFGLLRLLMWR
jgi:DNA mismatch repair protein MutL